MAMTDFPEDAIDVALSMVNMRWWSTKFRILSLIRVLQRRSPNGWASIGYRQIAERVGAEERYVYDVLRQLWKVDRVLLRGPVGIGTRGTAWRVNPRTEEWRNVPWKERRREVRALRAAAASREPDRGANDALAPGPYVAALEPVAPRSLVAALDDLAPRSISRRNGSASAAVNDRGASDEIGAPTSSGGSDDQTRSRSTSSRQQQKDRTPFVEAIEAALVDRNKGIIWGRTEAGFAAMEGEVDLEWVIRCIKAAPNDLGSPATLKYVQTLLRRGGGLPAPATGPTVAHFLEPQTKGCPECDHGWVLDDDGRQARCPACSAPRDSHTPVAQ